MALIAELPSEAIIGRFRGVLDFAGWCQLNIVRTWPRSPGRTRSIPCALAGQQFSYANKNSTAITDDLFDLYSGLAVNTAFTWKDWFVRLYMNASYKLRETQLT